MVLLEKKTLWNLGVLIYILLIGTAFLGYVLPWGQISFWAATVITNLLSAIPYLGESLVIWVWGGFAVGNPTLTRFFILHYILPFIIRFLAGLHIFYLHLYTRSNPLGINSNSLKVRFHYFFRVKDILYFILFILSFIYISCKYGYIFIDSENFIPANRLITPIHIQPEWYFLFAYAILRSIPNKLGGVIGLGISILILFLFSFPSILLFPRIVWRFTFRSIFWIFSNIFGILTWLGRCPAQAPFEYLRKFITIIYFILIRFIILLPYLKNKNYIIY